MRAWVILFLAIASEVAGTVALKYAVEHVWIYGVAAFCFILAFVLLHRVMQEGVNVGVAYGLWASGGVISTALLSAALFGEPLGAVKLAGIALIMGGVFCVEMGAKPHEDEDRMVEVAPQ